MCVCLHVFTHTAYGKNLYTHIGKSMNFESKAKQNIVCYLLVFVLKGGRGE